MTFQQRPDFGGSYHESPATDLSGQVTSFVGFFCYVNGAATVEDFVRIARDGPEIESLRDAVGASIGTEITEVDVIMSLNSLATEAKLRS